MSQSTGHIGKEPLGAMAAGAASLPSVSPALGHEDSKRLDALYRELEHLRGLSIGYPCNQQFDYRPLYRFLY